MTIPSKIFPLTEDPEGRLVPGLPELRDRFALAALQGDLASQDSVIGFCSEDYFSALAKRSYQIADAMLKARLKEGEQE